MGQLGMAGTRQPVSEAHVSGEHDEKHKARIVDAGLFHNGNGLPAYTPIGRPRLQTIGKTVQQGFDKHESL